MSTNASSILNSAKHPRWERVSLLTAGLLLAASLTFAMLPPQSPLVVPGGGLGSAAATSEATDGGAGLPQRPVGAAMLRMQALGIPAPASESVPASEVFGWGWMGRAGITAASLLLLVFALTRPRTVNLINAPGFEVVTPTQHRRFIPLEEKYQALDFVARLDSMEALRLSANLNKVSLSIRRYGYLLEDKNYRNALLVNRRRVRRTMLRDGDVLDLGDLTLLYRDNRLVPIVRHSPVTPPEGKVQLKFERLRGPVRKGMAMLVPEQFPNRIYYMSKNKIYIGRSEECDLILKAQDVYYHHAKIERVGGRYKLQDLTQHGNTFVNNRRVEQRYLKEGDEISIESHRFKFQFATKAVRERFVRSAPVLEDVEADRVVGEAGYGEEDSTELSAD